MAIGRKRNSRKKQNKNVLKTRSPNNSRSSRYSTGSRNSSNSLSSIWSKNSGPKKPRSPKQIIFMILILFAFICGLLLGISMIMGIGGDSQNPGEVQYMNVTDNITVYENSSYDLQDENGTQISYYDFKENVTEGQNVTAFNASGSLGLY
ncbi:MAG: hypothetical protein IJH35_05995 [Methanobrevibacter sp.]|nr:hypothetical protein [Methanobrevibacter sp.]